ncbi:MAG: hypothetical protein ACLQME_19550 [Alphaproteobacteria bacterium]
MSEHKPEKKVEETVSPAEKAKPGIGKIEKGELSEKELDKASGGTLDGPQPHM